MLAPHLARSAATEDLARRVAAIAESGLRVLLFAESTEATTFTGDEDAPGLPPLQPLGLVILADVLRPNVGIFRALDFLRASAILRAAEPVKAELREKLGKLLA